MVPVLKGEPLTSIFGSQSKSQGQPDGDEGRLGNPITVLQKVVVPHRFRDTRLSPLSELVNQKANFRKAAKAIKCFSVLTC